MRLPQGLTRSILAAGIVLIASRAHAGPIFLTGHDPDFHAQLSVGAQNLLRTGLQFATNNTYNSGLKFLWVESFDPVISGHLRGEDGLNAIGLTLGVHYDWVDAVGFAAADLSTYDAIGVASSFGGMLTQDELDALIARSADIKAFINAGGGLFASSECAPSSGFCDASLLGPSPALFGYLPVTVTSVATSGPYTVTAYGASLGLTNADVNDPTHNSFGAVGGLNIVDTDAAGTPTTLAGVVTIDDGGFEPVPEPGTFALVGAALLGAAWRRRRAASR